MLDKTLAIDKVELDNLEKTVCIDDLLQPVVHLRCPKYKVSLFVREKIHDELMDFLGGKGINPKFVPGDINYRYNKLSAIAAVIYQNRYRDELYRKEQNNPVIAAMKFMDKGRNDRLYCREIYFEEEKQVIICEIHSGKKNQENRKKEKNIIKKVARYEFKIQS